MGPLIFSNIHCSAPVFPAQSEIGFGLSDSYLSRCFFFCLATQADLITNDFSSWCHMIVFHRRSFSTDSEAYELQISGLTYYCQIHKTTDLDELPVNSTVLTCTADFEGSISFLAVMCHLCNYCLRLY